MLSGLILNLLQAITTPIMTRPSNKDAIPAVVMLIAHNIAATG